MTNPIPPLAPLPRDQRKIDADQLNLLAIFHFVGVGLAVLGILFLLAHYTFMHAIFANPEMWKNQKQSGPSPQQIFDILKWFYLAGAVWFVTSGVLNLISGLRLRARKGRTFSLVVAGMNCLHFPLGTVLGIFTIIILSRESVREVYSVAPGGGPVGGVPPIPG